MPCPEIIDPLEDRMVAGEEPPPPPPPEESDWQGFSVFTDVHQSMLEDQYQQTAATELYCLTYCNQPICGGVGGWLAAYSNDPVDLALGCDSPNNPIPGMLGL